MYDDFRMRKDAFLKWRKVTLRITAEMYQFGNLFALLFERVNFNTNHLKSLNFVGCTTNSTF